MKFIGYARVSSKEQNLNRQLDELKSYGCEVIYQDKQSGKDTDRPQLQEMIDNITAEDCIVITSLDRLSRDYAQCVDLWKLLSGKANIKVLDMPLLDTTTDLNGLDSRFITDLFIQILSYVAQKERENINERQRQGIASAKERGVKFGRKAVMSESEFLFHYDRVLRGEIGVNKLIKELGIHTQTYYNYKKKYVGEKATDNLNVPELLRNRALNKHA